MGVPSIPDPNLDPNTGMKPALQFASPVDSENYTLQGVKRLNPILLNAFQFQIDITSVVTRDTSGVEADVPALDKDQSPLFDQAINGSPMKLKGVFIGLPSPNTVVIGTALMHLKAVLSAPPDKVPAAFAAWFQSIVSNYDPQLFLEHIGTAQSLQAMIQAATVQAYQQLLGPVVAAI